MKTKRIIIVLLLAILGFILPVTQDGLFNLEPASAKPNAVVLQGITRHDPVIYNLFEEEFKAKYPEVSDIQWLEISDP
ncbi:MAG: hypothetical protein ACTSR2_11605, partial [Candidatus Hodarchaeales archaeon]